MLSIGEITLRLLAAALLGSLVGWERERHEWVAGLRTHMLVCLGSAVAMIVSSYGFFEVIKNDHIVLDPSRIAAQVISGIGFLGAGTIIYLRHNVVKGLTTAAGLWTVAAIGLAVGAGMFYTGVVATLLAVLILGFLKPLERIMVLKKKEKTFSIVLDRKIASFDEIENVFINQDIKVLRIEIQQSDRSGDNLVNVDLAKSLGESEWAPLAAALNAIDGVKEISIKQSTPFH